MFKWIEYDTESETGSSSEMAKVAKNFVDKEVTEPDKKKEQEIVRYVISAFPVASNPPGNPLSMENEKKRKLVDDELIDQFYLVGPVGDRFFHWLYLLGAADNEILFENDSVKWKKIERPKNILLDKEQDEENKKNRLKIVEVEKYPFWRALLSLHNILLEHLKVPKPDETGFCEEQNSDLTKHLEHIPPASSSEIFRTSEIYEHAKFPPAFDAAWYGMKKDTEKDAKYRQDPHFIRTQMEFEWLITRPYTRRWVSSKEKPEAAATGFCQRRPAADTSIDINRLAQDPKQKPNPGYRLMSTMSGLSEIHLE